MSNNLTEAFTAILNRQLTQISAPRLAIAFSGGVDSSLLAKMCAVSTHDVTLLTVGFQSAHDIELSRAIRHTLQLPLVDRDSVIFIITSSLTKVHHCINRRIHG